MTTVPDPTLRPGASPAGEVGRRPIGPAGVGPCEVGP